MEMTREELGARFKSFREHLEFLQDDVKDKTGLTQNTISLIENGKGGSTKSLLKLINFYSQFFLIDNIFSEFFEIKETRSLFDDERLSKDITKEKLKILKEKLCADIDNTIEKL